MSEFVERYVNPSHRLWTVRLLFKKLFGEEPNKDILFDFLNELLREEQGQITELTDLKNEHLDQDLNRKAVFDHYCTNERGEHFKRQNKIFSKIGRSIIRLSRSANKPKERVGTIT